MFDEEGRRGAHSISGKPITTWPPESGASVAVALPALLADSGPVLVVDKFRHARTTLAGAGLARMLRYRPTGPRNEQARRAVRDRQPAPPSRKLLADSQAGAQDAARRRGRHDHAAVADAQAQVGAAERRVEEAIIAERDLRERLATLAEHQQRRQEVIADLAPKAHGA